ncbi:MAG: hypothetical protein ACOX0M_05665 [Salinivirgaceae bacterium]|jgi:hypothetical protein|nr:hypothetical protein [Bacteroidales bacterium]
MKVKTFNSDKFKVVRKDDKLNVFLDDHLVSAQALSDLSNHYKVPSTTLYNFQERSPVTFLEPVLRTLPSITAVLSDDETNVEAIVHPKKKFVTDEQLQQATDILSRIDTEEFQILGIDHWRYKANVERPLQGGLILNVGLLRLACMNGATVSHSDYKKSFNAMPAIAEIQSFRPISPYEFLNKVFDHDRLASVADLEAMAKASEVTNPSDFFPIEKVYKHYLQTGNLNLKKTSKGLKKYLSSGLLYFDCFNILSYVTTHFAKPSFELNRNVGSFLSVSSLRENEIRKLSQSQITAPVFDSDTLEILRGDKVAETL